MKQIIQIALAVACLSLAGCSTPSQTQAPAEAPGISSSSKPDATPLEGAWRGHEVSPGQPDSPASLTISGHTLDFHGNDANDWCKGTFTLDENATPKQFIGTITDCAGQDAIGKKVRAIYKIENGALTISGNPPGDSDIPGTFEDSGARHFILKLGQ